MPAPALFSFDLGTNSIGWAVLGLADSEPCSLMDCGVRIFPRGVDPHSQTPLGVNRRLARGQSRRRDRYKRRRRALLRVLTQYMMMPDSVFARQALIRETSDRQAGQVSNDVYTLRARALDEQISLHQLGRIIFHLNQRRGFKSNRKTDQADKEIGKVASGIQRLQQAMDETQSRTLGEFLYFKRTSSADSGMVRARLVKTVDASGKEIDSYGIYPQRAMLEAEFNLIWHSQAKFHPELTEERRQHLFAIIFHQRPLKKPKIGQCSFNPDETRLPKCDPFFQMFRLVKEINELTIRFPDETERALTLAERDQVLDHMKDKKSASFAAIRRLLKLPKGAQFKKESDTRDRLKGDEITADFSSETRFGTFWFDLPMEKHAEIIAQLNNEDDPVALDTWLTSEFALSPEQRDAVASTTLPSGYSRLGITATREILDELLGAVIPESEAAKRAGYDHALQRIGDNSDTLERYQEILGRRIPPGSNKESDDYDTRKGRISNPTVHIALNQLRRVVNRLIKKHGKPDRIVVEIARDLKQNEEQRNAWSRQNAKNAKENRRLDALLDELKQERKHDNRLILSLWEELGEKEDDRLCIYTGKLITRDMLFSNAVEVDHILPFSRTLDNSRANLLLCLSEANRAKGNMAPGEVPTWSSQHEKLTERANILPSGKKWRFSKDAMERFEKERDFLARQLTDTQYLSRMAHEYLASLYPDEEPDDWGVYNRRNHVHVVPGRLTSLLRRAWGLNSILSSNGIKNRDDQRHHAIDAIVVGATTRSMLQQISTRAGKGEDINSFAFLRSIPLPWPSFREAIKSGVRDIVVSYKPDHGTISSGNTAGKLHNDTAYGIVDASGKVPLVVRKVALTSLPESSIFAQLQDPGVRDTVLRLSLYDYLSPLLDAIPADERKKALPKLLSEFPNSPQGHNYKGIRSVRVTERLNVVTVKDEHGVPYKGYKPDSNFEITIWEMPDLRWQAIPVSMFDAHQSNFTEQRPHPAARKIMTLKQLDMVAYEQADGVTKIARVIKFSGNQITLADHNEGGALKARDADKKDPFKYLSKSANALRDMGLRHVRVDEIGTVFDPGRMDKLTRDSKKTEF